MEVVGPPNLLFRPHPLLGWSLTPNSVVKVPFRDGIIQNVGPDGWRIVPNNKPSGTKINLYGCSWTYGTGLSDNETLADLLQVKFPYTNFRNRGCGGYGTVHNYIQFRQEVAAQDVDVAVFLVFSDHRFRNTPHPHRWKQFQHSRWDGYGVNRAPISRQSRNGKFNVGYIPLHQPVVGTIGLNAFLPNDYMLDQATFATLRAAQDLADLQGVKMIIGILDNLDLTFNTRLLETFDNATDISVPHDEDHFHLPHDNHPNAYANILFSKRLQSIIKQTLENI